MNKKELAATIAEKMEVSKVQAEKFLGAFQETVVDAAVSGTKIQWTGFLTFDVIERAAREGRNPQSGESIKIAASKAPRIKAGKSFKDAVNSKA